MITCFTTLFTLELPFHKSLCILWKTFYFCKYSLFFGLNVLFIFDSNSKGKSHQKRLDVKAILFSSSDRETQRCNGWKSRLSKLLSLVQKQLQKYNIRHIRYSMHKKCNGDYSFNIPLIWKWVGALQSAPFHERFFSRWKYYVKWLHYSNRNGNGCKDVRGSPTLMVHPADAVSLIFGYWSPPNNNRHSIQR